jgi:squalene-associated FAD-dependent desaturase
VVSEPVDVVVVGGGLAGLAAACALGDAGLRVTVLESGRRLGGATYSFVRRGRLGEIFTVDNGQHVVLACYQRYLALLTRLGTIDRMRFQPRLRIPVLAPDRPPAELRAARLPAPVHLLIALARYRLLTPRQRWQAVRAARAISRLDPARPEVDRQQLGAWLRARGQDDALREMFWRPVFEASLNLDLDEASLALAAMVIRVGFVDNGRDAARIGVPDCSLADLHVDPAARYLSARGCDVVTGRPVRTLLTDRNGWRVVTDAGAVACTGVVLAVPPEQAARLLPRDALAEPLQPQALGSSPIVSVHLHLDRRVLRTGFTAVVGSDVPWIFDRTSQLERAKGQYLTMPISAADAWFERPSAEVVESALRAVRVVLPAARPAQVQNAFVTRQRHATFRQAAGSAALRPATRTRLGGLVLAGAWTDTGWPDTIEGAVRSGEAAAGEVLGQLAAGHRDGPGRMPAEASARGSR